MEKVIEDQLAMIKRITDCLCESRDKFDKKTREYSFFQGMIDSQASLVYFLENY